jgi:hypothetical protein
MLSQQQMRRKQRLKAEARLDHAIHRKIGSRAYFAAVFGGRLPAMRKDYAAALDADADFGAGSASNSHHASRVADLLVEASDGKLTRAQTLSWLLHNRDGAALLLRMSTSKQQTEGDMPRTESLQDVVKAAGGLIAFAKNIVIKPSSGRYVSEPEFVKLVTDHAKAIGTTFVKLFTSDDEDGLALRQACEVIKAAQFVITAPTFVGGGEANAAADQGLRAYEQLVALANEQRKRAPFMSFAQAYTKVYEDPENASLAQQERAASRSRLNATLPSMPI